MLRSSACHLIEYAILGCVFAGEKDCGQSSYPDAGTDPTKSSFIVGGWETRENEFPYQVSLVWFGSHFCGGSVVNPRQIITAAHCVVGE